MKLADDAVATILRLAVPTPIARKAGLTYAPGAKGMLDVYRPGRPRLGAPMAVFFYGGSWQSGDRGFYRFVGAALASRGIITVIPDYRVHPEVRYPDFLHDCAEAVAYARGRAGDWGADPAKLFLIGQSAGAYNAAMLALDRRWLGAAGLEPSVDLAGAIGLAGPYDFLPLRDKTLETIFGPEEQRPLTQPLAHAHGRGPPMLLLAGGKDTAVRPGNTVRLARAVRAAGGDAESKIYPQIGHSGIITAMLAPLRHRAPVLDDIVRFVAAHGAGVGCGAAA